MKHMKMYSGYIMTELMESELMDTMYFIFVPYLYKTQHLDTIYSTGSYQE